MAYNPYQAPSTPARHTLAVWRRAVSAATCVFSILAALYSVLFVGMTIFVFRMPLERREWMQDQDSSFPSPAEAAVTAFVSGLVSIGLLYATIRLRRPASNSET